jgi:hypothetical protein
MPATLELKKQLWILPFSLVAAPKEALSQMAISADLQSQMNQVFGAENSPFSIPNADDSTTMAAMNMDSSADPHAVAKLARSAGSSGFVRGEIAHIGLTEKISPEGLLSTRTYEIKLDVNWDFYDSTTGRKLASGKESQDYSETRSDLFGNTGQLPDLANKLDGVYHEISKKVLLKVAGNSDRLGWFGRIVRIEAARVYLNAGRRTGIQVGETLKVIDTPKDIVDPQGGNYLGQAPGRVKGTLKVVQHFGLDGAIAVIQSGGGVMVGDRVELY